MFVMILKITLIPLFMKTYNNMKKVWLEFHGTKFSFFDVFKCVSFINNL